MSMRYPGYVISSNFAIILIVNVVAVLKCYEDVAYGIKTRSRKTGRLYRAIVAPTSAKKASCGNRAKI